MKNDRKKDEPLQFTEKRRLSLFWRFEGSVLVDFTKQAVTAQYYQNLLSVVRNVSRKPRGQDIYLLQDNAPILKAAAFQVILSDLGFPVLKHLPYIPDLAPSDFHVLKRF